MVTEATRILEDAQGGLKTGPAAAGLVHLDVKAAGDIIGVPVVIRPWWGSRRQMATRMHLKCNSPIYRTQIIGRSFYCWKCAGWVPLKESKLFRNRPGKWVCPGAWNNQIKWPRVVGDHVVMWEGKCQERYAAAQMKRYGSATHVHRQTLECLDFSTSAMLVRVSVWKHELRFLIGLDDGHPFVQVVRKKVATVADAYTGLEPVPVLEARLAGFDVKRQGDWYFVPRQFWGNGCIRATEKPAQPLPRNRRGVGANWDENHPFRNVPMRRTRHVAELFIFHLPFELVKGTVTAPDHPPLVLDDWHCAMQVRHPFAVNLDARPGDGAGCD